MARRRVVVSAMLLEHARKDYAAPSFDMFHGGPLAAAKAFFERRFDEAPELAPGIRAWVTIGLPVFPPLAFYAVAVEDHIEILDFSSEDSEYWDTFGDEFG